MNKTEKSFANNFSISTVTIPIFLFLASSDTAFTTAFHHVYSTNNIKHGAISANIINKHSIHIQENHRIGYIKCQSRLYSDNYNPDDDANKWLSSDIPSIENQGDWEDALRKKDDGSFWSSFSSDSTDEDDSPNSAAAAPLEDFESDEWLDTLASIAADEIDFINREADRADKVRQMQDMGFNKNVIAETLGVATDDSLEKDPENELMEKFQEETKASGFGMYVEDDIDLETVESHTTVPKDEETGEIARTQMVYVDEHACIGCTNCACIAQSTFFMESEHGRARVFQQWGDDDETIQIAIETCPVDCIHYVPYEELERLEIERRDQNINFKARLVNQGEYGGGHGGAKAFTAPQEISGNMGSRCNNCPSRGCKNCPMFGIGKNPYFEAKEKERKLRAAKRRIKEEMESNNKSADL